MKADLGGRAVRMLIFIVLAMGVLCILISLLILGLSAFGLLGILADVGPEENRDMAIQLLSLGIPALIGGVVLCVLGLLALAWNRQRTVAEPDAVPSGSPTQPDSTGDTVGPPSVG